MKTKSTLKMTDILSNSYFCEGLSLTQVEELSHFVSVIHLRETEVLFDEGDKTGHFFVVASGVLEVLNTNATTETLQELRRVYPGDFIGEMALIEGSTHTARLIALKESSLLTFNNEKLLKFLREKPEIGFPVIFNLAKKISNRLRFLGHPCDILFTNDDSGNNN